MGLVTIFNCESSAFLLKSCWQDNESSCQCKLQRKSTKFAIYRVTDYLVQHFEHLEDTWHVLSLLLLKKLKLLWLSYHLLSCYLLIMLSATLPLNCSVPTEIYGFSLMMQFSSLIYLSHYNGTFWFCLQ